MGLPEIAGYALPARDELPTCRVGWRPDAAAAALLVHDMQGYFVRAFPPRAAPIAPMLANIARLAAHCRARGVPVIYSAQPGRQDPRDRGLQGDIWGPGMGEDGADSDIVAELAPEPGDLVITKWRYSAFQRTTLEPMLRARGRRQLIVVGVYAHIGCMLTAADAFMRDIEPFLVADAVADFSRTRHDAALAYVADRCGRVISTDDLLKIL
ncbi:isochorismatase family protein [Rhodoplanes sp. TEM]|uniref:Isochorismatase family protein n=1 Tax=Rhodoplanes tepidamans TaxID=200616 RepID=A0ABT5JF60_RHOTP|nr:MULTISPECIES: isochorismatase family protein [Rhodoplanes]MDC7788197.1 isochorismatase family protein [Rhodoplanes tepidamans]MDC7983539.1 isochorismatase family protein [Rhodoplanes sp. TEM]MDQ0354219.1 bifunctional isochorismate lyase/aryl carrier protein [Rhodoplanes tepidamans]